MIENLNSIETREEQQQITDETLPDRPKVAEVAAWLRLHYNTIYSWARDGKIPCVKRGRTIIFDKAALLKWARPKEAA
jgi:excisionase family DNA binding protein